MTIEIALLPILPVCAIAALILAIGRLIYVFAVPYADPGNADTIRRSPGLRTKLLGFVIVAMVVGGLLISGAVVVLTNEVLPGLLRLAAYFVVVFASGIVLALIGLVLVLQNHFADEHALKTGRGVAGGERLWRSNLLEIGLLFGFGCGVLWFTGFKLPDPADATLSPDTIDQQLLLLRLVAGWAFLAGSATVILRFLDRIEGSVKITLTLIGFSLVNSVFLWVYGAVAPSAREAQKLLRDPGGQAAFASALLQAETLALVGVALALMLTAAPLLDLIMKSVAPGLLHRFGRMLCFIAVFVVCTTSFVLLDRPAGIAGSAVLSDFVLGTAVGISLGIAAPPLISALSRVRSGSARKAAMGLALGCAILAFTQVSSFQLTAVLVGAAAVLGAGASKREPKPAEPAWAEVF